MNVEGAHGSASARIAQTATCDDPREGPGPGGSPEVAAKRRAKVNCKAVPKGRRVNVERSEGDLVVAEPATQDVPGRRRH